MGNLPQKEDQRERARRDWVLPHYGDCAWDGTPRRPGMARESPRERQPASRMVRCAACKQNAFLKKNWVPDLLYVCCGNCAGRVARGEVFTLPPRKSAQLTNQHLLRGIGAPGKRRDTDTWNR